MLYTNTQSFANITDSNITLLTPNSSLIAIDPDYITFVHPVLALNVNPDFYVDNVAISLDAVGSGGNYEANRISSTQTVIKVKNRGAKTVSGYPVPAPIGDAVVGSTFIIE